MSAAFFAEIDKLIFNLYTNEKDPKKLKQP
jgi:hypothetical protein